MAADTDKHKHPPKPRWTPALDAELRAMCEGARSYYWMSAELQMSIYTVKSRMALLGLTYSYIPPKPTPPPARPKPRASIAVMPVYDFRAWSRGALPGHSFIYWVGKLEAAPMALRVLVTAMEADPTVELTDNIHGEHHCWKVRS